MLFLRRPARLAGLRHARAHSSLSPDHAIYVSSSSNPYFNLTLEDWLFRHKNPHDPLLLVYRDAPCVVIGRNQNPWAEANLAAARARGVPVVRRRSGGGTVYHDLGNTNFSLHLPRAAFDRHASARLVLRAVRALGADARVNARNDICVGPDKMSAACVCGTARLTARHVSGSAYKIVNTRAYHHGTMLLRTRLGDLGDLLRVDKPTMATRGVASVRSPVSNLERFCAGITHEGFTEAVVREFRGAYGVDDAVHTVDETPETTSIDYIARGMAELPSWEWLYGQTPEFTYTVSRAFPWGALSAKIHSKHGIILSCELSVDAGDPDSSLADTLSETAEALHGKRYGFVADTEIPQTSAHAREVWAWLKGAMGS